MARLNKIILLVAGLACAGLIGSGARAQAPRQGVASPAAPRVGGRRRANIPPKPASEEYLLLGNATRGSGEAQLVVDPTNPDNIAAVGMGTWQIMPGCKAPDVNCVDDHNYPYSTLPVAASTSDGGRTWKHFILPILSGKFTRCPDPFAGATKDGILIMGCEPRETSPTNITPPGESAIVVSTDHGKSWGKRVDGISSYNKAPYPTFAPGLKPRFGGNSPWDRPFLYFDDKTGAIYLMDSGGQTDIDTGTPGKWRTESYFTVSNDQGKSFGTIRALDDFAWPQMGRASVAAGLGSFAEIYEASKVPASQNATCPCQVFGISYNQGKTFTRHVMKNIVLPPASAGRGAGGRLTALIADPTTEGRFSVMRYIAAPTPHYEISTSNNNGKTWSPFAAVGTVPGAVAFIKPAIKYSRWGVIGLVWKAVYPDQSFDLWSAVSRDDGSTFSEPLRISHRRSLPRQYYRDSLQDDNSGIDLSKDNLYAIWGDTRAGFNADWFGKVSLSSYRF